MARTALRIAAARSRADLIASLIRPPNKIGISFISHGPSSNRRSAVRLADEDGHHRGGSDLARLDAHAAHEIRALAVCANRVETRALLRHDQTALPRPATAAVPGGDAQAPRGREPHPQRACA